MDVERLRSNTPGVKNVIHFNNAGCSLPDLDTLNATKDYLDLEAQIGGYVVNIFNFRCIGSFFRFVLNAITNQVFPNPLPRHTAMRQPLSNNKISNDHILL